MPTPLISPKTTTTTSASYSREDLDNRITLLNKSIDRIESDIYWDNSFLSPINNIIDIAEKVWYTCGKSDQEIKSDHYCVHITKKSWLRCITLLIPIVGRVVIYAYDYATNQINQPLNNLSSEEEILRYAKKLGKALYLHELKNINKNFLRNEEFMLKLFLMDPNTFQYADPSLKENADFICNLIKISTQLDSIRKFDFQNPDIVPRESLKAACRIDPTIIPTVRLKMDKTREDRISFFLSVFYPEKEIKRKNMEQNVDMLLKICQQNNQLYDIFGEVTQDFILKNETSYSEWYDQYIPKLCAIFWLKAIKHDKKTIEYAIKYDVRIASNNPDAIYALIKYTKDKFWFDTHIEKFPDIQKQVIAIAKCLNDREVLSLIDIRQKQFIPTTFSNDISSDLMIEKLDLMRLENGDYNPKLNKVIIEKWIAELKDLQNTLNARLTPPDQIPDDVKSNIEHALKSIVSLVEDFKNVENIEESLNFDELMMLHDELQNDLSPQSTDWLKLLSEEAELNQSNGILRTIKGIKTGPQYDLLSKLPEELIAKIASYNVPSDQLIERLNDMIPEHIHETHQLKKTIIPKWIAELNDLKSILNYLQTFPSDDCMLAKTPITNTLKSIEPLIEELQKIEKSKNYIPLFKLEEYQSKILLQLSKYLAKWMFLLPNPAEKSQLNRGIKIQSNDILEKIKSSGILNILRNMPSERGFLNSIVWDKKELNLKEKN